MRIGLENGGFDRGDRRYMTEGTFYLGGHPVAKIGIFDRTEDAHAFARSATVYIPRRKSECAMTMDRIETLVNERLREIEEQEREDRWSAWSDC